MGIKSLIRKAERAVKDAKRSIDWASLRKAINRLPRQIIRAKLDDKLDKLKP